MREEKLGFNFCTMRQEKKSPDVVNFGAVSRPLTMRKKFCEDAALYSNVRKE